MCLAKDLGSIDFSNSFVREGGGLQYKQHTTGRVQQGVPCIFVKVVGIRYVFRYYILLILVG